MMLWEQGIGFCMPNLCGALKHAFFPLLFRENERSAYDHHEATSLACTVQNPTYTPTDICDDKYGFEDSVEYEDMN